MKFKIIQEKKSGARTLHAKPGKNEQLIYEQAEWLKSRPSVHLLDFKYIRNDDETDLYYDITGLVDLRSYLRASLSSAQYAGMLGALEQVLSLCNKRNYPSLSLRFDPEHVYVDPEVGLKFVFNPLGGGKTEKANTPTALLSVLGDPKKVSFVVADDSRHASAVYDYVNRNPVLSLSSYRQFLEQEFKLTFSSKTSGQLSESGKLGHAHGTSGRVGGRSGGIGRDSGSMRNSGSMRGPATMRSQGAPRGSGAISRTGHPQVTGPSKQTMDAVTFDPVAVLSHAPAASDIVQGQSIAQRVRDGVSGTSPTAASQNLKNVPIQPVPEAPAVQAASQGMKEVLVQPGHGMPAVQPPCQDHKDVPAKPASDVTSPRPASQDMKNVPIQPVPEASADRPAPVEQAQDGGQASEELEDADEEAASDASAPKVVGVAVSPQVFQAVPAPVAPPHPPAPAAPKTAKRSPFKNLKSVPIKPERGGAVIQTSAHGTTMFGGGVKALGSSPLGKGAPKKVFLVRERDGSRYLLESGQTLSVGRSSQCDIRIDGNSNISRIHLSIRCDDSGADLTDIGSSNGTYIQGRKLSKGQTDRVRRNEEFRIANEVFRISE